MILLISCCPLPNEFSGKVAHHQLNEMPSFLSAEKLASQLPREELSSSGLIILPGDFRELREFEELTGKRCVLGPTYCANLPVSLANVTRLSKKLSAEKVLAKEIASEVDSLLEKEHSDKPDFKIGNVGIGRSLRTKVIAEIVDAPLLSDKELRERAEHYAKSGADIIDIGMLAYRDSSSDIPRIFSAISSVAYSSLSRAKIPLSIDSFCGKEITAAIDSGAKLVLSLSSENLALAPSFPKDVRAVVVPDMKSSLQSNIASILKISDIHLIADPILRPLGWGFTNSLFAYKEFRANHPEMAMMMGSGNATELVDSDSAGANAILAGMASETGCELLLTTEASEKTKGSVSQLSRATRLFYAAKKRGHPPKDVGIKV